MASAELDAPGQCDAKNGRLRHLLRVAAAGSGDPMPRIGVPPTAGMLRSIARIRSRLLGSGQLDPAIPAHVACPRRWGRGFGMAGRAIAITAFATGPLKCRTRPPK